MNALERVSGLDFVPGRIPEIDEHTREALASLILDETVELAPSGRGNLNRYGRLTDQEFIGLFQPLVEVLQLDPATDPPPLRTHIERASKLGLVPSQSPIYDRMTLSKVHTGLGFRAKFRFNDWMISDFVSAGQKLAGLVDGRPTRDDIAFAGRYGHARLGDFPTVDDIKSRFGKISVFHELIGFPSCKGWVEEDYLDWAFAFYRQNPGAALTARTLDRFSTSGRGPSKQPVIKYFGSISKFKEISTQEFRNISADEQAAKTARLEDTRDLARNDESLLHVLAESEGDSERVLQTAAQYRLAKRLVTSVEPAEIKKAALLKSPDSFVRWCITKSDNKLSAADVETHAAALGIFDDLWPMYRFQNVDLRLI